MGWLVKIDDGKNGALVMNSFDRHVKEALGKLPRPIERFREGPRTESLAKLGQLGWTFEWGDERKMGHRSNQLRRFTET